MSETYGVLIVGAGHGGARAALALREFGYDGTIGLVGDEPDPPYDRPPLSKEYLSGTKSFEQLVFRTHADWSKRGVTLLLGRRVASVDPENHAVTLESGASFGYGRLIWAAGGQPRRLTCSGAELARVHSVRTRADADRMIDELPGVQAVVVIGGGYIGLEVAAVLTKSGKHVTVLEAMDRVLARVAGEPLSRFYEDAHRAQGVSIRLNAKVDCILGENGHAHGVRLANGEVLPAQMVVIGIGIVPGVEPLLSAGADGEAGGVAVDEYCRTSLADIHAVGDCAAHINRFANGERVRLESVQNANDQATIAAKAICGRLEPYQAVPWFWSNQYDLKLQTIGLSRGYDEALVRGDPARRSFSVVYLRAGQVIALDCVNAVRDYTHGRALVVAGARPDRAALADPAVLLKSLV